MSTPAEETKEQVENVEQQPEEVEAEEPVDLELQKEMKKATIDEKMFEEDDSKKKEEKEGKKAKKAKGVDFLDYANKNNIQINIQYEQDKFADRKKYDGKQNYRGGYNKGKYKKNFNNGNQSGNNNNGNNNNRSNNKYSNNRQNNPNRNKNNMFNKNFAANRFGANKFDVASYNPVEGGMAQEQYYKPNPVLNTDEDILTFLQDLFSANNLNNDIYLRRNINEDGKLDLSILEGYNVFKRNKISNEKIVEQIPKTNNLELSEEGDKKVVTIKGFKDMNLVSLEALNQSRKNMRMQRNQQMNMMYPSYDVGNPMIAYNYYSMQNNIYFQNPGYYQMPEYGQVYQTSYQMPVGQMMQPGQK